MTVLSDDPDAALEAAVQRITGLPMADRRKQAKDLGEIMVIAHASTRAERGDSVDILIDDGPGAALATTEMARLVRLRAQGNPFGRVCLYGTLQVLEAAAGGQYLPDRATMKKVYKRLRECDDGLVEIGHTNLLSNAVWTTPRP